MRDLNEIKNWFWNTMEEFRVFEEVEMIDNSAFYEESIISWNDEFPNEKFNNDEIKSLRSVWEEVADDFNKKYF